MFEIRRRVAYLPILVVPLGTFELMLGRRVPDFTALVAEIESQIFAGIGFLIAVAEGAIKRIVGFRFITRFLFSIFGLSSRSRRRCKPLARLLGLESLRTRFRSLRASLGLGWRGCSQRPRLGDRLALDDAAFDRRFECARTRSRGANRARRLRFALWLLRTGWLLRHHFANSCRRRVRVEHMAASRALKRRSIVGQDPLIDTVAGVATGALNFDHSSASPLAPQIIILPWCTHLFRTSRRSVMRCG
jgi:hypothetical protein